LTYTSRLRWNGQIIHVDPSEAPEDPSTCKYSYASSV
jgi:hypothetical protein